MTLFDTEKLNSDKKEQHYSNKTNYTIIHYVIIQESLAITSFYVFIPIHMMKAELIHS